MKHPIIFIKYLRAKSDAYTRIVAISGRDIKIGECFIRPDTGLIHTLRVDADYRGYGIGERLMRSALYYAETVCELEKVHLHVADDNYTARNLYNKLGFELESKLDDRTIQMTKRLTHENTTEN